MSKKFIACLLLLAACSSTPPAPKPVAVRPLSKPPVHQLPASLIGEDRQQQERHKNECFYRYIKNNWDKKRRVTWLEKQKNREYWLEIASSQK